MNGTAYISEAMKGLLNNSVTCRAHQLKSDDQFLVCKVVEVRDVSQKENRDGQPITVVSLRSGGTMTFDANECVSIEERE